MSRWFRVTAHNMPWDGVEFDVDDDATQEEIDAMAHNAVIEWVDYGYEEIGSDEVE